MRGIRAEGVTLSGPAVRGGPEAEAALENLNV